VMASFSSFAAQDTTAFDLTAVTAADMAAATTLLAGATADQYAVITQNTGSVALIEQTGLANRALISQANDNSAAVILQTGATNFAAIVQK